MMIECPYCGLSVAALDLDGRPRESCPVCKQLLAGPSAAGAAAVSPGSQIANRTHNPILQAAIVPPRTATSLKDYPQRPKCDPVQHSPDGVPPGVVNPRSSEGERQLPIRPWHALALTVIFVAFAVFFFIQGRLDVAKSNASLKWPTTTAAITSCQSREIRSRQRYNPIPIISYTVDLKYRFKVSGEQYEGTRIQLFIDRWNREQAESHQRKYYVGSTHTVFYNPNDPEDCVLVPGERSSGETLPFTTVVGVILPLVMIPVAALMLAYYWLTARAETATKSLVD